MQRPADTPDDSAEAEPGPAEEIKITDLSEIDQRLEDYYAFRPKHVYLRWPSEGWNADEFGQMVTHLQSEAGYMFGKFDPVPMIIWLQEHGMVPSTQELVAQNGLPLLIDVTRSILSTQASRGPHQQWNEAWEESPPSVFSA